MKMYEFKEEHYDDFKCLVKKILKCAEEIKEILDKSEDEPEETITHNGVRYTRLS